MIEFDAFERCGSDFPKAKLEKRQKPKKNENESDEVEIHFIFDPLFLFVFLEEFKKDYICFIFLFF